MKITLTIGGAVDDWLEIYINNTALTTSHYGGWTKCSDYTNIWCSPILSPVSFNITNYINTGNNQIKLRARSHAGENWLVINSFNITLEYYSE